jgi:phage shock protein PspC (stress-responsive transcriptional regulator)
MKKTISVNIKGLNFLIEEDAYELLQNYLDRLSLALKNEKGGKEIEEDIEMRIAELCSEQLSDKKQVIEVGDIERILETLGDPAQYVQDDQEYAEENTSKKENTSSEKRIYRDTDNAVIAGVCSGIANYTNIDVVIVRAIFAAVLIFGGFGLPLYIVLWIIIPKASTTIDKLRMRGKPINVDTVRDEVEQAAERLSSKSQRFAQKIRKDDAYQRKVNSVGRIFAVLIGTGIIAFGLILLVLFLIFVVGGFQVIPVQSEMGFLSFPEFGQLIVESSSDLSWSWIGILLLGFSSILFLLLLGSKIIFQISNIWSKIALGGLFFTGLAGLFICIFLGVKTSREMSIEGELSTKIGDVAASVLMIETVTPKIKADKTYEVKSKGRYGMMSLENDRIIESGIEVEYKLSQDSLFHIYQTKSAHSHSHQKAIKKAENIRHRCSISGSSLKTDSHYSFPKKDKLRDQDVVLTIEIPINGKVYWNGKLMAPDKSSERILEEELSDIEGYIGSDGKYHSWDW